MTEEVEFRPMNLADAYNEMLGLKQNQEDGKKEEGLQAQEIKPEEPTPPTPETPATPPTTQEQDWFDLSKLNQRLGFEFKSEEEIKESIRSLNENKEYLSKREYFEELEKIAQEFQNEMSDENLVKSFGSKENFDKAVMIQHLSQLMPQVIAAQVVSSDVNKMDNLEALYIETISRDPNLLSLVDESTIKKGILKQLGVDISDPEFDLSKYLDAVRNTPEAAVGLSTRATAAKNYFKGLTEEAKKSIPIQHDFKQELDRKIKERGELLQKRTNDWTIKAKDIASQFNEFKITEKDAQGKEVVDFTFAVPKEFQDKVANYARDYAVQNGLDVTPETVAQIQSEIQDAFEDQYKTQIRKSYMEEKLAKYKEELDNKIHNPKPVSTQEAPPDQGTSPDEELQKQRKAFGLI
jgi:hypothetical protein